MKKILFLLALTMTGMNLFAQRIEFDVIGNLEFRSHDDSYNAYLKEDILHSLIFTDSNGNEITYTQKYLKAEHPNLLLPKEDRIGFFKYLIGRCRHEKGYNASYSIDLMGKTIIEDSKGNKLEAGTDIFGNPSYEETHTGMRESVKKDLMGAWEYRLGSSSAQLKQDIFKKWCYSDSAGNKLEISESTWRVLLDRYGSEDSVLIFLVNTFLTNIDQQQW